MARISAADTLAALKSDNPPRLAILGSSRTRQGRLNTMMKIRPSLLDRLDKVAMGPTYLLLEYSLEMLLKELESRTPGTTQTVDAARFDPTPEDVAGVERYKKPV